MFVNSFGVGVVVGVVGLIFLAIVCLRQVNQYETGLRFTMGRLTSRVGPGWRIVIPVFQELVKVDMRTVVGVLPTQQIMTIESVTLSIDAIIRYRIIDAEKVVLQVGDYGRSVILAAVTQLKQSIGGISLSQIIGGKDTISDAMVKELAKITEAWGIVIEGLELSNIQLPESMIRAMARVAESQREGEASLARAEGELAAAGKLAQAAKLLAETPGGLSLKALQVFAEAADSQNAKVIIPIPMELLALLGQK